MLTRHRLASWVLLIATAIVLALCVAIAFPFIPALTWAVVFAILVRPIHVWLERHVSNKSLTALMSVALVAIVLLGPVVWIGIRISQEIAEGIKQIQAGVQSGAWDAALHRNPALVRAYGWLNERVDLASAGLHVANLAQVRIARLLGKTIETFVQGFISLFALFFFLRDRNKILRAVRVRAPLSDSETKLLMLRVRDIVRATIFGRMLTSLVQGALGGVMFWILGLDAALLWGAAMAALSMIPAVGSMFIWGPAAAWLAITGHWVKAIVLAAWGSAIIGTIDNILYPLFVGRDVKSHTLLLLLELLGGVLLFGPTGLVLGPVIVETGLSLVEILRERTRNGASVEQTAETG